MKKDSSTTQSHSKDDGWVRAEVPRPPYIDEATDEELAWARAMQDAVNAPSHYNKNGKIECIDAIKEALGAEGMRAYIHGNLIKYAWRWDAKGKPVEDLRKLRWYTNRLICELIEDDHGL